MNIGNNIKIFRIFRGLKQQDIAEALGRTKSVISNWERGENSPDVESCEKLCKLLKVTPNELFGWDVNKEYLDYQRRIMEYQTRIDHLVQQKQAIDKEINALEAEKIKELPSEDIIEG